MKKGCFLVSISFLTVIIAAGIYLIKFHQDDLLRMIKPMVVSTSEKDLDAKIDHLSARENSDSLKKVIGLFIKNIDNSHKIDFKQVHNFFEKANKIVYDGRIDSVELNELTGYIKNQN